MKSLSSFFLRFRAALPVETLRTMGVLLLREAVALSLFSLAALLSLESLLPGTVSLRESMIFFILGIACVLVVEQRLSGTISPIREKTRARTSKRMRVLFVGFILWSAFLLGNALFNFHPAVILAVLLLTIPVLVLFFGMAFGDRRHKKDFMSKEESL